MNEAGVKLHKAVNEETHDGKESIWIKNKENGKYRIILEGEINGMNCQLKMDLFLKDNWDGLEKKIINYLLNYIPWKFKWRNKVLIIRKVIITQVLGTQGRLMSRKRKKKFRNNQETRILSTMDPASNRLELENLDDKHRNTNKNTNEN
jgi:hypothetical protein